MDETRIPLDTLPELYEEVERLMNDRERMAALRVERWYLERLRREGLPRQLRLFVRDSALTRALLASAERHAA